jgi:hypothetical protein
MPLQNIPLILENSRICIILLQDLMKRDVCWCMSGDALKVCSFLNYFHLGLDAKGFIWL